MKFFFAVVASVVLVAGVCAEITVKESVVTFSERDEDSGSLSDLYDLIGMELVKLDDNEAGHILEFRSENPCEHFVIRGIKIVNTSQRSSEVKIIDGGIGHSSVKLQFTAEQGHKENVWFYGNVIRAAICPQFYPPTRASTE